MPPRSGWWRRSASKGLAELRAEVATADGAAVPTAAKQAIALLGREADHIHTRRRAIDATLMRQHKVNPVSKRRAEQRCAFRRLVVAGFVRLVLASPLELSALLRRRAAGAWSDEHRPDAIMAEAVPLFRPGQPPKSRGYSKRFVAWVRRSRVYA